MDMSESLGNIYDRYVAIVFGTLFFSTFWRLWKLVFWGKFFQNLMFSFYPKNGRAGVRKTSITQAWLVVESCLSPHWVTFLLFCRLVYNIPSLGWFDFGLKYLVTVMLKGQPPEFKASVWNFPISETGCKCNSVFGHADSNWVIIMELKRKVEHNWTCTF